MGQRGPARIAALGLLAAIGCDRIAGYHGARARDAAVPLADTGGAVDAAPSSPDAAVDVRDAAPAPDCDVVTDDAALGTADEPLVIRRAASPPKLTLALDPVWCTSPAVAITRGPDGPTRTTPKGHFRVLYDDDALYFSIDVEDASLVAEKFFFWENDGIDIVLDVNASRSDSYEADDVYVGLEVGSREVDMNENAPNRDFTTADIKMFEIPGGARWMMALPFTDLGTVPPAPSASLGLDVQIRDENGAAADLRFRWFSTGSDHLKRPATWGHARFE